MSDQPAAATVEELTARCGHECLEPPDHDGLHFYGYRCGPYSYEGLLRRIAELEAAITLMATTDPIEMADAVTPTVSSDWRSYANNGLALLGREPSWSV